MPSLFDLGALSNSLSNSLISQSSLWKRDVSTITQTDILVFLTAHRHTKNYGRACREINAVIDAGAEALISGIVDEAEFVFFEMPKIAFTSDDMIEWLSCVSDIRQKALLFSLEMNMDPKAVIGLEWKSLRELRLTPTAYEIVTGLPRHMNLKYVFWDFLSNGSAAPLFGLAESALEVSQGLGFDVLRDLYKRMVLIDEQDEIEKCLQRICADIDSGIVGH